MILDRLLHYAGQASRVTVWAGGAALIFAAAMTTVDVVLRKTLNWSFGGADEIAGYIFAGSTAFALAFTMLNRANVRIDALYLVFPRRIRLFLDIFGFTMLGGFLTLITLRAHSVWWGSVENSSVSITPLVTPLAVPQGIWFAGLCFSVLIFALLALRVVVAVITQQWMKVSELIGARSLDEEIEEERLHAEAEIAREHELTSRRGGGV